MTWTELLGRYNPAVHDRIVLAARRGLKERAAAGFARIKVSEMRDWISKGIEGVEPFATLVADIEEALADDQYNYLDGMDGLTRDPDPKVRLAALKWGLERKHGFAEKLIVEGPKTAPPAPRAVVDVAGMSIEQVLALADAAEAELKARGLPPDPALLEARGDGEQ